MHEGLLSDVKVVEYGDLISAPYCGRLLAELGAEVVKVEKPGEGDEARRYGPFPDDVAHPERSGLFLYLNTDKIGVTLNLENKRGISILKELLQEADVFIENNPPAKARQLGIDYGSLWKVNPRLVACSITPYGHTGPYKDYTAYHLNAAALGGRCVLGLEDREPLTFPLLQGHFQAGLHGCIAVLLALHARRKTGRGQHCDVAEADVWAGWHTGLAIQSYIFGQFKKVRWGSRQPGFYPFVILPCKDGYVSEVVVRSGQWERFLRIIGDGEIPDWWKNDPRFEDRVKMSWDKKLQEEADALQAPWLMAHTKEEIWELCRKHSVPFCPVYDMAEIVNHPYLEQRGYFVEIDHPEAGRLKYPGAHFRFSEVPFTVRRHAPLLGQDNEAVYCERLGYSRADLAELHRTEVI